MVTFASFVPPLDESYGHGGARYVPDDGDDMDMDLDDDDFAAGSRLTCPGEPLTSSHAFMRYVRSSGSSPRAAKFYPRRGHGTYVENEEVVSSVAGTVERVNKLISVRGVRTR